MKDIDKERIISRYNQRLNLHGDTIAALASGTEERREIRFSTLTEIGIQAGDSVLDLGCGFGDFALYLDKIGLDVEYTGYDINDKLIEIAKKKLPEKHFEVKDILNEEYRNFDYIVSTSCFNLPLTGQDNYEFVQELLANTYAHANKGVAIDFLTSYVDFKSDEGFHYEPEKIFAMAKKLTKRVMLRHDYPLFEFCIYMYKDFAGWQKK